MNDNIVCPYCNLSDEVSKFGKFEGIQRYWCKRCKRKFTEVDNLPRMKTPVKTIASALSCYFGGMPLDAIQRHLNQQHSIYLSESGIYNWIIRFSREAVERSKDFRPDVGSVWVADETMISVGGRKIWFWDIIDLKTRYLLASHISLTRTTQDAATLMYRAAMKAGKAPSRVITDKLAAYLDGIELVFGADSEHIQSKPFTVIDSTNVIERFHGTLKQRTKIIKGFKNFETAQLLTDAWLVYYNFMKEHESLGNVPPAQRIGKVPFKDWAEVLAQVKQDMLSGVETIRYPEYRRPAVITHTKTRAKPRAKKRSRAKSEITTRTTVSAIRMR